MGICKTLHVAHWHFRHMSLRPVVILREFESFSSCFFDIRAPNASCRFLFCGNIFFRDCLQGGSAMTHVVLCLFFRRLSGCV